jgi:hypothetical protein
VITTPNAPRVVWRKSTHSGANDDNCVEVASMGNIWLRDSKDPDGGFLTFSRREWSAFIDRIKGTVANI